MPVPKRKQSKARSRKRRTHYKPEMFTGSRCPNCGKTKLAHYACPHCGFYQDRPVIQLKVKE